MWGGGAVTLNINSFKKIQQRVIAHEKLNVAHWENITAIVTIVWNV